MLKVIKLFITTALMLCMGTFYVQASETEETIIVNTSWLGGELLRLDIADSETDTQFTLEIRLSDYILNTENSSNVIVLGDSQNVSNRHESETAGNSAAQYLHLTIIMGDSESEENAETLNPDDADDETQTEEDIQPEPSTNEPDNENPVRSFFSEPLSSERLTALIAEAEKYLGMPYRWGGSTPETSFDCSGLIYWTLNQSGVATVERTTAQGYYDMSVHIPEDEAQPGDLVFFHSTYATDDTVTHVGIYTGNGYMIHAGDPIQYESIRTDYWRNHFIGYGRINHNSE
jgi:cell wall-associated NlpC family hydrolase